MNKIKSVVFSGGAFKGWAYIGTIRALQENNINPEHVVGVSVGSLFALMYALKIEYTFLLQFLLDNDIKDYLDFNIDSILENQSILEGNDLKILLMKCCQNKINEHTTLAELYDKTGVLFTTCAFNITTTDVEYFNKENTPYVTVIDAIMASASLPLLLPAYKINDNYYYDGGICNNCPCNLVDPETSIVFDLCQIYASEYKILELLKGIGLMLNKHFNNINKHNVYVILDTKFENETFNLNQSKDMIFNMYMNGYINSKKALNNLDLFEKV
jgi:predicted acylesterase/phospholipase RssA